MARSLKQVLANLQQAYVEEDDEALVDLDLIMNAYVEEALHTGDFDLLDDAANHADGVSYEFLVNAVTEGIYSLSAGSSFIGALMVPVAVLRPVHEWNDKTCASIQFPTPTDASFLRQTLGFGAPEASYYTAGSLIRAEALWGFSYAKFVSDVIEDFQSKLSGNPFSPDCVMDCMVNLQTFVERSYRHRKPPAHAYPSSRDGKPLTISFAAWPIFVSGLSDEDLLGETKVGEAIMLRGAGLLDDGDPRQLGAFVSGARLSLQSALGPGWDVLPFAPVPYWRCYHELESIRESFMHANRTPIDPNQFGRN